MNSWINATIGAVAEVVSGGTPDTKRQEYWGGGIQWITPSEIEAIRDYITEPTCKNITEAGLKGSSAVLIPEGSIILCSRATIGECAINTYPITTNQGFKNLVPNGHILTKFLYYWVLTQKKALLRISAGSTFLEFSGHDLKKLPIVLPPLEEQRRIIAVLEVWDKAIELLDKKIELKDQVKKGLVQQLLSGKKRLPGFFGAWKTEQLGKVGWLSKDIVDPRLAPNEMYLEYSMPAFDNNQTPDRVVGSTMKSIRLLVPEYVLLFNKLNVRKKRIWLVLGESGAVCSTEFLLYCSDQANLVFLKALLSTARVTFDFVGMSSGTSNSQKRITANDLLSYHVSLPPLSEQQAIAAVLEAADAELNALRKKRELIAAQRKFLLNNLVTGKLRVPENVGV